MNLLLDHTTGRNIIWASGEHPEQEITPDDIPHIKRRIDKTAEERKARTARNAEVFTPTWVCNKQNNLCDNAWFGHEGAFNTEIDNGDVHTWEPNRDIITFPDDKTWWDYLTANRMEITCGEAPYLVSRYETVTGEEILVPYRIGLLDRKLRVLCEQCRWEPKWRTFAIQAVQSIYGFDWQGDNVYLARKNILDTVVDYYEYIFRVKPQGTFLENVAHVVTQNIVQMDGIKFIIPNSCTPDCPACQRKPKKGVVHNGVYVKIKDWQAGEFIEFRSLLR